MTGVRGSRVTALMGRVFELDTDECRCPLMTFPGLASSGASEHVPLVLLVPNTESDHGGSM